MASALMRRSAVTALLAAVATIASPLVGTGWAAAPALTAPTGVAPADGSTVHSNRPAISFTYNTALNEGASTLTVVDTSASNAGVPCAVTFSPDASTIGCTLQHDLTDGHVYGVAVHAENSDSSSKRDDGTTWTDDIPSLLSTSPGEGATAPSTRTVSATYDERIDTSHATVTVTNGAGHTVPGSVSVNNASPVNNPTVVRGTVTFTTSSFSGLGASSYTVAFHVDGVTAATTPNTFNDNPAAFSNNVLHFTIDNTMPPAGPYNVTAPANIVPGDPNLVEINQDNVTAVPFSGYGPPGFNVAVAIYDENFDSNDPLGPDPEGFGQNDSIGTTLIKSCASPISPNGVPLCPFTVAVDASNSPDTSKVGPNWVQALQWYAFTFTSAGQVPLAADPTNDPNIGKDTTGPSAPAGASAFCTCQNPDDSNNFVTVQNISDSDPQAVDYLAVVSDFLGKTASGSGPLTTPTATSTNVDLGAPDNLADGSSATSPSTALTVNVYGLDKYGNRSSADAASPPANKTLDKEKVRVLALDPSDSAASDSVTVGGTSYDLSTLPTSRRFNTPTGLTITFNEPIRLSPVLDGSGQHSGSPVPTGLVTQLCFNDSGGDCLNSSGGTLSESSDKRTVTWTAPAGFSLPPDTYTVNAVGVSATCVDKNNANLIGYSCEHTTSGTLATFAVDDQPPTVHITSVPQTIDASNSTNVAIGGDTDGDTREIDLTFKSSGGGALRFVRTTVTPSQSGTGRITWSTLQDLSRLPDGTLTITARGVDEAGNITPIGSEATATSTIQQLPSAPQNLTATAGNGQAVLTWQAPATTGGVPLRSYTLTVSDTTAAGSTPQTLSVDPAATSYTATGLANGHAYSFSLTAANNIGSGPAATTTATPKGNTAMSAFASQGTITFGSFLAVRGTLSYFGVGVANEPVTISTVYFNGSHGNTYHATTDQNGNWVIAGLSPAKNVTYVASFGGDSAYNASSGAARVFVRELVRISKVSAANSSHLTKVKLSGNVRPSQAGRRVYVYELLAHGRLHYLGYAKLTSRSTWTFTRAYARGKHTLVARFLSQNGNVGNWSNRVRFTRT